MANNVPLQNPICRFIWRPIKWDASQRGFHGRHLDAITTVIFGSIEGFISSIDKIFDLLVALRHTHFDTDTHRQQTIRTTTMRDSLKLQLRTLQVCCWHRNGHTVGPKRTAMDRQPNTAGRDQTSHHRDEHKLISYSLATASLML
jgi:hypothetical protein